VEIRRPKSKNRKKAEGRTLWQPEIPNLGFPSSEFFRPSKFGRWIWAAVMAISTPLLARAAEANGASDLPPAALVPPRGEILPSFGEQYGAWLVLAAILVLGMISVGVWLLLRPKAPMPVRYAALARQELEPLRQRQEDGTLLSRTSQIVRRYVAATFALPPNELTTAEFCQAVLQNQKIGPDLSNEASEFLRACDIRKFAPAAPGPALGAVDRALRIIERAEGRVLELNRLSDPQNPDASDSRPPSAGSQQGMPSGA
jgi:hypothetical protein